MAVSVQAAICVPAVRRICLIWKGWDNFEAFLSGAHAMDKQFCTAPFRSNPPKVLAALGAHMRKEPI